MKLGDREDQGLPLVEKQKSATAFKPATAACDLRQKQQAAARCVDEMNLVTGQARPSVTAPFKKGFPNMVENTGNMAVMALCLLSENDFQRFKNRSLITRDYADYIEQFYDLQAEANTKGYQVIVVVFSEASFNEYLEAFKGVFLSQYGHEPVTEEEYAQARARWAHWFVTSDRKRFGL